MRIVKYLLSFGVIIGLGLSAWFYYPQYEIHKMKKQSVEASTNNTKVSYINYFRNIKETQVNHLAIGDSVIHGVGAQQNDDLVSQFSNKLAEQIHKKIQFKNKGISGITSDELNDLVQKGQFDAEIKMADIVTINVGGNDVIQSVMGQDYLGALNSFDQIQSSFSKNLADIAARINKLNPKATIVFLELYNPLSPANQVYSLANQLLPKWNLKIYQIANQYSSSIVVETTKVINGENLQNLSRDGVHPSSAGYTAISEQMIYQFKHQYRKETV